MVLSGEQVRDLKKRGKLSITPILDESVQFEGSKVDLRLDNKFHRIIEEENTHYDTLSDEFDHLEEFEIPFINADSKAYNNQGKFILHPGEFALAKTFEFVNLPSDIIGILGGRSSLGRHGIVVHATASVIDPGYAGNITLELTNFGNVPVVLYPRQRVATIFFERIEENTERYKGKFGGSSGPVPEDTDEDTELLHESI